MTSQPPTRSTPPRALPGFSQINRYWDHKHQVWLAKILPGNYYVTNRPEVIFTVLGSCISACIRDRKIQIGGMNHFMLPDSHDNSGKWANSDTGDATRYGTFAMEHLINEILKNGGRKETLEIKLVGGARIVKGISDVGQRNIAFIRHYLAAEGYSIAGEDLGDIYPRKVMYHPGSGRLQVKRLRSLHNDTIIERENSYRDEIDQHRQSGEIDLF